MMLWQKNIYLPKEEDEGDTDLSNCSKEANICSHILSIQPILVHKYPLPGAKLRSLEQFTQTVRDQNNF